MPATPARPRVAGRNADGSWLIYCGDAIPTQDGELESDNVDVVIDLTQVRTPPRFPALIDNIPIGTWTHIAITPTGITARLALLDTPPVTKGLIMFDTARQTRALIDQAYPLQVSVSVVAITSERIEVPIRINGQRIAPRGRPLFVVRTGEIRSAALVF